MCELKWRDGIPTQEQRDHAMAMVKCWRDKTGCEAIREFASWQKEVQKIHAALVYFGKADPDDLTARLERVYPNAKPRRVVTHNGNRYCKRYFPIEIGDFGKVYHWGAYWEDLGPVASRARKFV